MKSVLQFLFLLLATGFSSANNIRIDELSIGQGKQIEAKLSWENAWNYSASNPKNHDAVWLFAKGKTIDGLWEHILLSSDSTDHTLNSQNNFRLKISDSGHGILLHTTDNGTFPHIDIQLSIEAQLNLDDYLSIKLFGIEMVYINEGSFYLGDSMAYNRFGSKPDLNPFLVNGEQAIVVNDQNGSLISWYDTSGQVPTASPNNNIPASYPKGFGAFYCMKYEINQLQYTDFLNCLTSIQQQSHVEIDIFSDLNQPIVNGAANFRNGIKLRQLANANTNALFGVDGNNNLMYDQADDGLHRACNFLNWSDLSAYLDWTGLRPMTGFEFEKIGHAHFYPKPTAFPWLNTYIKDAETPVMDGTTQETVLEQAAEDTGIANYLNQSLQAFGPLRNGFLANQESSITSAGSSYYGIMELAGNVWEQCVNVSDAALGFTNQLGDGILDNAGFSNEQNWCSISGDCAGYRGGGWNSAIFENFRDLAVSDRYYAFTNPNLFRHNTAGGRGVLQF